MRRRNVLLTALVWVVVMAGCSTQQAADEGALDGVEDSATNKIVDTDSDGSSREVLVADDASEEVADSSSEPLTVETGDSEASDTTVSSAGQVNAAEGDTASPSSEQSNAAGQSADGAKGDTAKVSPPPDTQATGGPNTTPTTTASERVIRRPGSTTPASTKAPTTSRETPGATDAPRTPPTSTRPSASTTQAPTTQPPTSGTAPPPAPPRPPSGGSLLPVYTPNSQCGEGQIIPRGQAAAALNFEPLGSIWCFDLNEPPTRTAVVGANSWVDDFTTNTLMQSLDDREMGYRIFNAAGANPGESQHWINQNHWMVDAKEGFTGGASMRPDRSFRFENGKLVVEGDFAAAIPEYGDSTWGEITITTAAAPTGVNADDIYAYGQFGGHWAIGCRLHSQRDVFCAIEGPQADSPPDSACFSRPGDYRVSEMSYFQACGTTSTGGRPDRVQGNPWRACTTGGFDMACRDRFRMEVTQSSITLYVNGVKFFEDANWPRAHQLPDSFVNSDVYVYQSNWQYRTSSHAFRYHWDHFAVNPPSGPSASEWYGRPLPQNVSASHSQSDDFFCQV